MRDWGLEIEGWAVYRMMRNNAASMRSMTTISAYESALAVLAVLACAVLVGCRPSGAGRPLVVVVSGDTAGWIVPCGCTSNQSGGLPRRATYIEGLRGEAEVVPVDVGGAAHGTSPYDLAKFEAILRGEVLMGVAAHNIGAAEARFGPAELRRLAAKLGVPLLSANVRDRCRATRGRAGAIRVGRGPAAGPGRRAVRALRDGRTARCRRRAQAVLEALRGVAGKYDAAIVLAYLPEDELRQLADALPEADVVVGGPTGQPISPKQVGPTLLASATNKGKFLARLDAPALGSADRWTGEHRRAERAIQPTMPEQMAGVDRFRAELARRDFAPSQTSFAEPLPADLPKGFAVAGDSRVPEVPRRGLPASGGNRNTPRRGSRSKAKGAHVDPECQRCHTTGYGLPGGFASVRRSAGDGERRLRELSRPLAGPRRRADGAHALFRPGEGPLHRLPRPREQPEVRLRQVLGEDSSRAESEGGRPMNVTTALRWIIAADVRHGDRVARDRAKRQCDEAADVRA